MCALLRRRCSDAVILVLISCSSVVLSVRGGGVDRPLDAPRAEPGSGT